MDEQPGVTAHTYNLRKWEQEARLGYVPRPCLKIRNRQKNSFVSDGGQKGSKGLSDEQSLSQEVCSLSAGEAQKQQHRGRESPLHWSLPFSTAHQSAGREEESLQWDMERRRNVAVVK